MGYNIRQTDDNFLIAFDKLIPLSKALAKAFPPPKYVQLYDDANMRETKKYLTDLFEELAFSITLNVHDQGITEIHFRGEKSWKELELFTAIAPFVKQGLYVEFSGEDGEMWRYVFTGKKVVKDKPKIIWSDPMTLK